MRVLPTLLALIGLAFVPCAAEAQSSGGTFQAVGQSFETVNNVPFFTIDLRTKDAPLPRPNVRPRQPQTAAAAVPRTTITPTPTPRAPTTPTPVPTLGVAPLPTGCTLNYYFIDEFNGGLSATPPQWSWTRENPANWSITPQGWLEITTETGGILGDFNSAENLLLRDVPVTDWVTRTLISFDPTDNFHQAGILCYVSDDIYLSMFVSYSYGNVWVRSRLEVNGRSFDGQALLPASQPVYLEVSKAMDLYTTRYSTDGINWSDVALYNLLGGPTFRVGLLGLNDISPVQNRADFDYFEIFSCEPSFGPPATPGPPTPTATPSPTCDYLTVVRDEFNGPNLDPNLFFVRENPSNWSLAKNPGSFTIETQFGGLNELFNNAENVLLQSPSTENWDATIALDINLSANFQQAGLIVYENDDQWFMVSTAYSVYWGAQIEIRLESGQQIVFAPGPPQINPVWFRIHKRLDDYYIYYSTDGSAFFLLGIATFFFSNPPDVGIFGYNDLGNVTTDAVFDFFEVGYCIEPTITPTPTPFLTPTPPCIFPPFIPSVFPPQGAYIERDQTIRARLRDLFGGIDISGIDVEVNGSPSSFTLSPSATSCLSDYNLIIQPPTGNWNPGEPILVTVKGLADCCGTPNVAEDLTWFLKGGIVDTPTPAPPSPTPTPSMPPSTPTPTSIPEPRILEAGYFTTDLDANIGGPLQMIAVARFPASVAPADRQMEIFYEGAPTGIFLAAVDHQGDRSEFALDAIDLRDNLAPVEFLLELGAGDAAGRSMSWPYLTVKP